AGGNMAPRARQRKRKSNLSEFDLLKGARRRDDRIKARSVIVDLGASQICRYPITLDASARSISGLSTLTRLSAVIGPINLKTMRPSRPTTKVSGTPYPPHSMAARPLLSKPLAANGLPERTRKRRGPSARTL